MLVSSRSVWISCIKYPSRRLKDLLPHRGQGRLAPDLLRASRSFCLSSSDNPSFANPFTHPLGVKSYYIYPAVQPKRFSSQDMTGNTTSTTQTKRRTKKLRKSALNQKFFFGIRRSKKVMGAWRIQALNQAVAQNRGGNSGKTGEQEIFGWCGYRDSNPGSQLGKLESYH